MVSSELSSEKPREPGEENAKTSMEATTIKTNNLKDCDNHFLQIKQWAMYRRLHPTFIPRQRLQNAIRCIISSFWGNTESFRLALRWRPIGMGNSRIRSRHIFRQPL